MKIYTRTGDSGTTGLSGGARVSKHDQRIVAYGVVDELNAFLGVCRATGLPPEVDAMAGRLQHEMFAIGAELASPTGAAKGVQLVSEESVLRLESEIDRFEQDLPPLRNFILPGGTAAAAALHTARCVCRRAERELVRLADSAPIREDLLKYVNRASDLLFVAARWCNHAAGVADVPWQKS